MQPRALPIEARRTFDPTHTTHHRNLNGNDSAMARKTASSRKVATPPTASGSPSRPVPVANSNSSASAAPAHPAVRSGLRTVKPLGTVNVGQPSTDGNRVKKEVKKAQPKPIKKECVICITTRQVNNCAGRGFKANEDACEHFQNTCNVCIAKMIKEKIVKQDLDEAVLACAFPDCEYVLDYNTIMQMIFKAAREK